MRESAQSAYKWQAAWLPIELCEEPCDFGLEIGKPRVRRQRLARELRSIPRSTRGASWQPPRSGRGSFWRTKTAFAWNATNLSRRIRTPLVGLFADCGARVRIVHCEASPEQIEARNRARSKPVPAQALTNMLERWQTPDVTECTELVIASTDVAPA